MSAMTAFDRQVAAAALRVGFSTGSRIVVAASGGPDSTALLRCLHRWRDEFAWTLHVAHFNHDFRGAEADHDAAFVQQLSDSLGLSCSVDKRDPIAYQRESGVSSFEQAAREMRYSFLGSVAESVGAVAVALGHTADDQAETVLLHLLRGSGLHGLRGMPELADWPWMRPRPGPYLFRPMIGVSKADTAAYCRALGQTVREDSGNYMWRFTRNKIRLDLMPRLARDYNPKVREALVRLSHAAAEGVSYMEEELAARWGEIAERGEGEVSFEAGALSSLHPALQSHALRRAYAEVTGDARAPAEAHVEAMLGLLRRRQGGRSLDLPLGVKATLQDGVLRLTLRPETALVGQSIGEHTIALPSAPGEQSGFDVDGWRVSVELRRPGNAGVSQASRKDGFTACLAREALGNAVTVRRRQPGDRFQPLGMTGTKKLQDFFTDEKVPREGRDLVPLVVCPRGIAWVVGHRVAEWAKASGDGEFVEMTFLANQARVIAPSSLS